MKIEKNLLSQTIQPLPLPIRVISRLRIHPEQPPLYSEKSGITNIQPTGFLV